MVAGFNVRFDVWRMNTDSDDYVGGAMITGTVVYSYVPGMFQTLNTQQRVLGQGLEYDKPGFVLLQPGTLDIRPRDEFQVVAPTDHIQYGKKYRCVDITYSHHNRRDPRCYIMAAISRSERAHTQQ